MRIAVFSDLHGNPFACRAVLDAIATQGAFDAIIGAGDLLLGGSDPRACFEMLHAAGVQGVYGNTEIYLLNPEDIPPDELHRKMWVEIQPVAYWVLEQIGAASQEWVRRLPFELRCSPNGKRHNDLLVTHANRRDVELMILPDPAAQSRLWGEVRQPDDDHILAQALQGDPVGVLAFGHFHSGFTRLWQGQQLVNVACCSLPGIDHDPRARYTVFEWSAGRWCWQTYWVEYAWQREVEALRRSAMPFPERFIRYFVP